MALSRFSVGSCCCNKKDKEDDIPCGGECEGGVIKYWRLSYDPEKNDDANIVVQNKVETEDVNEEGTFPKLPIYMHGDALNEAAIGSYDSNGDITQGIDVVNWRVMDDNRNIKVAEGYCRSLVPLEEFHYTENTEDDKKRTITGIELHKQPIGYASYKAYPADRHQNLIFIFDEKPYIRVFFRQSDFVYKECVVQDIPDSKPKFVFIKTENIFQVITEDDPYIYDFKLNGSGNVVWQDRLYYGITGYNFVKKNDKLFFSNTTVGNIFQSYDDYFDLANNRKINLDTQITVASNTIFTGSRLLDDGQYLYSIPASVTSTTKIQKYDLNGNFIEEITNPYYKTNTTYIFGQVDYNGTKALKVNQSYYPVLLDFEGNKVTDLPNENGSLGNATYSWDYLDDYLVYPRDINKTNRIYAAKYENGNWNQINTDNITNKYHTRLVKHDDDIYLVCSSSGTTRIMIYRLGEIETDSSTWSDPNEPEYEDHFYWIWSSTGIAGNNYEIGCKVINDELFIWGASTTSPYCFLYRFDKENDTFRLINTPVFGSITIDYMASRNIRDIEYINNRWWLMTDQETLYYQTDEENEDTFLFENGTWISTRKPFQRLTDKPYQYCHYINSASATGPKIYYLTSYFTDDNKIFTHGFITTSTSYNIQNYYLEPKNIDYKINCCETGDFVNLASGGNGNGTDRYYNFGRRLNMLLGTDTGLKHLKLMYEHDDEKEIVTYRWEDVSDIDDDLKGNVKQIFKTNMAINPIYKALLPSSGRYNQAYKFYDLDKESTAENDYLGYSQHRFSEGVIAGFRGSTNDNAVGVPENRFYYPGGKLVFVANIDDKVKFIILKCDRKNNIWNDGSGIKYESSRFGTIDDWFKVVPLDKSYLKYAMTSERSGYSTTIDFFNYGNQFIAEKDENDEWEDEDLSDIDKLFVSNNAGVAVNTPYSGSVCTWSNQNYFDFGVIKGNKVFTYTTKQAGTFNLTKGSQNKYRLHKLYNREYENIKDLFEIDNNKYLMIQNDKEKGYFDILTMAPNDGIPYGLWDFYYDYTNNYGFHSTEHLLNLDHRCFKEVVKPTSGNARYKKWCHPKKKDLLFIVKQIRDIDDYSILDELKYDVEWDTKSNMMKSMNQKFIGDSQYSGNPKPSDGYMTLSQFLAFYDYAASTFNEASPNTKDYIFSNYSSDRIYVYACGPTQDNYDNDNWDRTLLNDGLYKFNVDSNMGTNQKWSWEKICDPDDLKKTFTYNDIIFDSDPNSQGYRLVKKSVSTDVEFDFYTEGSWQTTNRSNFVFKYIRKNYTGVYETESGYESMYTYTGCGVCVVNLETGEIKAKGYSNKDSALVAGFSEDDWQIVSGSGEWFYDLGISPTVTYPNPSQNDFFIPDYIERKLSFNKAGTISNLGSGNGYFMFWQISNSWSSQDYYFEVDSTKYTGGTWSVDSEANLIFVKSGEYTIGSDQTYKANYRRKNILEYEREYSEVFKMCRYTYWNENTGRYDRYETAYENTADDRISVDNIESASSYYHGTFFDCQFAETTDDDNVRVYQLNLWSNVGGLESVGTSPYNVFSSLSTIINTNEDDSIKYFNASNQTNVFGSEVGEGNSLVIPPDTFYFDDIKDIATNDIYDYQMPDKAAIIGHGSNSYVRPYKRCKKLYIAGSTLSISDRTINGSFYDDEKQEQ